ncbi:MAG: mechanosensitive ion channel [Anaerolineae bacterium]|jgi:small conductance mechanosensitive channel
MGVKLELMLLGAPSWWVYLIRIAVLYAGAWLVHLLIHRLEGRISQLIHLAARHRAPGPERRATLSGLIASTVSFVAFTAATLISLGQFVQPDTLVWVVGLLSAGFGLSARPLISDVLSGINFIFEDTFAVGEKVEILDVQGVVEAVNLRASWIRAASGELYVVPNGEVRVIRNFSRGHYSLANIGLKVAAADLDRTLTLLEDLGEEAVARLPNLLEPWQVISASGMLGQQAELTLLAKARFGRAAEMRPRLLAFVHERLAAADIALKE